MSKHTPTPWIAVAGANPKHKSIMAVNAAGHPTLAKIESHGFAEGCEPDHANAEFIIRACNSHDRLVSALAKLLDHYERGSINDGVAWDAAAALALAGARP